MSLKMSLRRLSSEASERPLDAASPFLDIIGDVLVVLEEERPDGGEADPEGGAGAALDYARRGLEEKDDQHMTFTRSKGLSDKVNRTVRFGKQIF